MKYYATKISDKGNLAVDDTILVKGTPSTAGSKILEGYKPLFSAEAVTRLEAKGYEISGKTHVGEFGLDLVGEFSHYAPQEGALSGAAATLVAQGEVKAALGVDMNGATRRAAAISGVVCFILGSAHRKKTAEGLIGSANEEATRIVNQAVTEAETKKRESILEAKDEIHRLRTETEKELREGHNIEKLFRGGTFD